MQPLPVETVRQQLLQSGRIPPDQLGAAPDMATLLKLAEAHGVYARAVVTDGKSAAAVMATPGRRRKDGKKRGKRKDGSGKRSQRKSAAQPDRPGGRSKQSFDLVEAALGMFSGWTGLGKQPRAPRPPFPREAAEVAAARAAARAEHATLAQELSAQELARTEKLQEVSRHAMPARPSEPGCSRARVHGRARVCSPTATAPTPARLRERERARAPASLTCMRAHARPLALLARSTGGPHAHRRGRGRISPRRRDARHRHGRGH